VFSVYVYYRLDPRHARDAEAPIRALIARLACRCAASAQLLKKRDEPLLWMEAYQGIADIAAFECELERIADESAVALFIDGARHVECFSTDS
jgi:hypothetical protein